jgi:UTP--glucose-1-phosphate uridylyltransferase
MEEEGLPSVAIETFEHYYSLLAAGQTGLISETEIETVETLPDSDALSEDLIETGAQALSKTVIIKLNGGLGTTMGLNKAKSLLQVKSKLNFLDITALQALEVEAPLMLMNSFNTRKDSLAHLNDHYPQLLRSGLPLDFLQHKVPKISVDTLGPVQWPSEPRLEWCPPGHGDIYTALLTSQALDALIDSKIAYAFVSNSDNLGAVLTPKILGHFIESGLPFMMEVADRTPTHKKGGHLARRGSDGQLILRERAQCSESDMGHFEDTSKHRFFNTNNLWFDLRVLRESLQKRRHQLGLPMIRNCKNVDPKLPDSPQVYQLETAMGSAIATFGGAGAIRVPNERFAPVKTCQDLLRVQSDAFSITQDHRIVASPGCDVDIQEVELDDRFYKHVSDLGERFPYGPPSLKACEFLGVEGDILFGSGVRIEGRVNLINRTDHQVEVEDSAVISEDRVWS